MLNDDVDRLPVEAHQGFDEWVWIDVRLDAFLKLDEDELELVQCVVLKLLSGRPNFLNILVKSPIEQNFAIEDALAEGLVHEELL